VSGQGSARESRCPRGSAAPGTHRPPALSPPHLVGLSLQVHQVLVHVQHRSVVVQVLQGHLVLGVLLQEGVGSRHRFLDVV